MTASIDIGKAFTHLFEDADWLTKTAIGACLSLVPVLGFTVIGYELRVIRNVSRVLRSLRHPLHWPHVGPA
ncbi:MAG: hypothetical protein AABZ58_13680, partial [Chloroflexota bacterium]